MRRIDRGSASAAVVTLATALTLTMPGTASAHGTTVSTSTRVLASETRLALYQQHFLATLDGKLDQLAAYVKSLRAKVDAVPADTVLSPSQRLGAKRKLAKVTMLGAFLASLPETGAFAPTAAQQDRIDAMRASLAHIAARLRTLLANKPAVAPVQQVLVVQPKLAPKVFDTRFSRFGSWWDGHCDGKHDGDWGDRDWDGWDRDRDWDGWRR